MKVALVHYWLVNMRGGEKVLEALCELFPEADVFTHVYDPRAVSETLRRRRVRTTFIGRLPGAVEHYQKYLPLMPLALEELDLRGYDLIISSESGPAKGIVPPPGALHVCYCHTAMRYVWDMYHEYLTHAGVVTRALFRPVAHYLRLWDVTSAARVDHFLTNSEHVRARVWKYYRRESEVVHPPVDTAAFSPVRERGDFYLVLGELVPYKRADLAVEAFRGLGRPLVVIGSGERLAELSRDAPPNVRFLGNQPFEIVRDRLARCRALVFPGREDFGIVPVEAMASGRPVIAFGEGGARETVVEGETGLFFDEQTPDALVRAVLRYEEMEAGFRSERIAAHAARFDRSVFLRRVRETIETLLAGRIGARGASRELGPAGTAAGEEVRTLPASAAPPGPSGRGS